MYLMFMGPFTDGGDWSDTGIRGVDRFVQRVWRVFGEGTKGTKATDESKEVTVALHQTIKKVTESMEKLHFNTAISALMEFLNAIEGTETSPDTVKTFIRLLSPLAPHLAEELWEVNGEKGFIVDQEWPVFDPAMLKTDTLTIVVQVNGKVRGQIQIPAEAKEKDVLEAAKADANVQKFLEGKTPKKEIYVKGRLVSLVV
jgi:leucyl-tRNA synthetase